MCDVGDFCLQRVERYEIMKGFIQILPEKLVDSSSTQQEESTLGKDDDDDEEEGNENDAEEFTAPEVDVTHPTVAPRYVTEHIHLETILLKHLRKT